MVMMERAGNYAKMYSPRSIVVSGSSKLLANGFSADLLFLQAGKELKRVPVEAATLVEFVAKCACAIAEVVGGTVTDSTREMWRFSRPSGVNELIAYGKIPMRASSTRESSQAAASLFRRNPAFVAALWAVDRDYEPRYRELLLMGLRNDPYNAYLCFLLFTTTWQARGHEPAALQFIRHAIALAPGHGKSHMCAPHAAHPDVSMLPHSELGYRLLPGNTFAINNYITNLSKANRISRGPRAAFAGSDLLGPS